MAPSSKNAINTLKGFLPFLGASAGLVVMSIVMLAAISVAISFFL